MVKLATKHAPHSPDPRARRRRRGRLRVSPVGRGIFPEKFRVLPLAAASLAALEAGLEKFLAGPPSAPLDTCVLCPGPAAAVGVFVPTGGCAVRLEAPDVPHLAILFGLCDRCGADPESARQRFEALLLASAATDAA